MYLKDEDDEFDKGYEIDEDEDYENDKDEGKEFRSGIHFPFLIFTTRSK